MHIQECEGHDASILEYFRNGTPSSCGPNIVDTSSFMNNCCETNQVIETDSFIGFHHNNWVEQEHLSHH